MSSSTSTALLAGELLEQQARLEREAARVLPGDHDRCTFVADVPVDRQRVYACRTCVPTGSGKLAGVCYSCSISCHAEHELLELFTKRDFVCDCGNGLFAGFRCRLSPDKPASNPSNRYNHNFLNRYCRCDQPYDPDAEEDLMHQCAVCEDWYHTRCLYQMPPTDTFTTLVCTRCARNRPTLARHRGRRGIAAGYEQPPAPVIATVVAAAIDVGDAVDGEGGIGTKRAAPTDTVDGESEAKKLRLACSVADVFPPVGDVDLYLAEDWDVALCQCESCRVFLHSELEDVRQFIETIGRPEFSANQLDDDDDDDATGEAGEGQVASDNTTAAPAEPAEVTSTYDLGVAALRTRPMYEQQVVAQAIGNFVAQFKAELLKLRDQGVTEITSEHIEQIKAKLQRPAA